MHFFSGLIISLLLYHPVISSEESFLRTKISPGGENAIGRFFTSLKLMIEKQNFHHVIFVGASMDQLDRAKPLLEAVPYFVSEDAKEVCASRELKEQTSMIYFLASLNKEYLTKVIRNISHCQKYQIFFMFEGTLNDANVEWLLHTYFFKILTLPTLLHYSDEFARMYGYELQEGCIMRNKLIFDWTREMNKEELQDWNRSVQNFRGCPLSIGTRIYRPWMNLETDANGTVRIMRGGYEGNLILTAAQKINFTPLVRQFKNPENIEHDNIQTIVSSCAAGNVSMGISCIRAKEITNLAIEMSTEYGHSCLVWCVPKITQWQNTIIVSEFPWKIWLLIGLTFLARFVVETIVRNTNYLNLGYVKKSQYFRIILDTIAMTLGNPIVYKPLSIGGNVLLITYLIYSMVMTTAYKTSLSSILTLGGQKSLIVDVAGIIAANLTTGGSLSALEVLKDQEDENEFIPELIKRYVVENNISKALQKVSHDKSFAYLVTRSDLAYHQTLLAKAGKSLSFHVFDYCVLIYNNVIVFTTGSHFKTKINDVIRRLTESGILNYWKRNNYKYKEVDSESNEFSGLMKTQEELNQLTRDKFYTIFTAYCIAITFCIFTFLGELVVHKFTSAGRNRRLENLKLFKTERSIPLQSTSRQSN